MIAGRKLIEQAIRRTELEAEFPQAIYQVSMRQMYPSGDERARWEDVAQEAAKRLPMLKRLEAMAR